MSDYWTSIALIVGVILTAEGVVIRANDKDGAVLGLGTALLALGGVALAVFSGLVR